MSHLLRTHIQTYRKWKVEQYSVWADSAKTDNCQNVEDIQNIHVQNVQAPICRRKWTWACRDQGTWTSPCFFWCMLSFLRWICLDVFFGQLQRNSQIILKLPWGPIFSMWVRRQKRPARNMKSKWASLLFFLNEFHMSCICKMIKKDARLGLIRASAMMDDGRSSIPTWYWAD